MSPGHSRAYVRVACLAACTAFSGCPLTEPALTLYTFVDTTLTEAQTVTLAADAVSINPTKVVFYDNDVAVAEATSRPYLYRWDVTAADRGQHTWTAVATLPSVNGTRSNEPMVSNSVVFDVAIPATSACGRTSIPGAPYPVSPVICDLQWDSQSFRGAEGSDTFPITWGDDDALYTAYADGNGFPPSSQRFSMGLARVTGGPTDFIGENISAPTAEQTGDGRTGGKVSGMLMVDGMLYMWMRNADRDGHQCRLGWSNDHAATWTFADWTLDLGYCTFLNYGRNYEGARDDFVYIFSPDSRGAYDPADDMLLLRVPKDQLREQSRYQYFAGAGADGAPQWTDQANERGSVFHNPGRCARGGISYNAALGRYLWWQQIPEPDIDTRFSGGFGIYDAPEPWGPWTTAYFAEAWDEGPGETASFPTKWMSADGQSAWLVYSGDDSFSVRRATFELAEVPTDDWIYPTDGWVRDTPAGQGMDVSKLEQARNFALRGGGSGMVTRRGRLVFEWGDQAAIYDLKSTTKSFGATALGIAIQDGRVDINDRVQDYDPRMATDKPGVTFLQLLTHTGGFYKDGGAIPNINPPGTIWEYSDGGANRLAEAITLIYQTEIPTLMFERLLTPMGLTSSDLHWRWPNWHRDDYLSGFKSYEFGAGVNSNVDSMARLGYLYLREGQWEGTQLIPKAFVQRASRPEPSIAGLPVAGGLFAGAPSHYGLLWWNNADGALPSVPRDAFWSWGLFDSYILVIPSLEIVVARAGASWDDPPNFTYPNLQPFFEPIAASVTD